MRRANPDLPILDDLGAEFAALVDAELGAGERRRSSAAAGVSGSGSGPRRRARTAEHDRQRPHGARRVARRAAIVLVLLCLVGGVALAARFGAGGGERRAHTAPITVGADAAAGWRLAAYRDGGQLCFLLTLDGQLTSDCGPPPGPSGLRLSSAIGAGRRFVVGLAGGRVGSVAVRVGGARTATRAVVVDPAAARAAGVPVGIRWFVASLPLGPAPRAPALAVGRSRAGERLGAYSDCSLGVLGAACERQIRARAAAAGD